MFNWFKKKPSKDEIAKAKLAEKLKDYVSEEKDVVDITDTTWTDVEINGHKMRVPKISPKAIEELTLTEFEQDVTIVGLDRTDYDPDDPWAVNHSDTTQWHRAEKHGK